MTCEECKASRVPETIPFAAHEGDMVRAERTQKRLWIVILLLIVMLVGSNCAWLWYESQFEVVETTQTIEADATDGGNAIANSEGSVTVNGEG